MGRLDTDFLEFQFAHHFFYFDFKAKYPTSTWTDGVVKSIAQIRRSVYSILRHEQREQQPRRAHDIDR
ncbi:MAG: hypothetical protein CVU91_12180 [Firmicutes bacterium HGW-Firmicutes-16]|nr:MAG: hypothetical protein CVU91_12180 [Firmicutes bacterium HGW-Firmicutes-16]